MNFQTARTIALWLLFGPLVFAAVIVLLAIMDGPSEPSQYAFMAEEVRGR